MLCQQLTDPQTRLSLESAASEVVPRLVSKPCMADALSGCVPGVMADVLDAMDGNESRAAPAHNPPYIAAMRHLLRSRFAGDLPLVAAFETDFHAHRFPLRLREYAIATASGPMRFHIRKRTGFHGASHRYIADSLRPSCSVVTIYARVISCHLGGSSSSLTAIQGWPSVATSMGMSPQSGVPHNNRVGDFDPFAMPGDHAGDLESRSMKC